MLRRRAGLARSAGILGSLALIPLGCAESPADGLQIRVGLSPTPPLVGSTRVIIYVQDQGGVPVEGATVTIAATRSGESAPTGPAEASEQSGGRYVVPGFQFEAAGEWTLRTTVLTADGRPVERQETIRVSGPPR